MRLVSKSGLRGKALLGVFAIFGAVESSLCQVPEENKAKPHVKDPKFIEFLISQNEDSLKKLEKISYEFELESSLLREKGTFRTVTKGKVIEGGSLGRWTERADEITTDDGRKAQNIRRGVLNGSYLGYWPSVGQPYAYKHENSPDARLQAEIKQKGMINLAPDQLRFGFGDDFRLLRQIYIGGDERSSWEVKEEKDGGRTLYRLIWRVADAKNAEPMQVEEIVIDPDQGFLVTKVLCSQYTDGKKWLFRDQTVEVGVLGASQVFYPKQVEIKGGSAPGAKGLGAGETRLKIFNLTIAPTLSQDQFEIAGLGLSPQTKLITTLASGDESVLIKREGSYIPLEVDMALNRKDEGGRVQVQPLGEVKIGVGSEVGGGTTPPQTTSTPSRPLQIEKTVGVTEGGVGIAAVLVIISAATLVTVIGIRVWTKKRHAGG